MPTWIKLKVALKKWETVSIRANSKDQNAEPRGHQHIKTKTRPLNQNFVLTWYFWRILPFHACFVRLPLIYTPKFLRLWAEQCLSIYIQCDSAIFVCDLFRGRPVKKKQNDHDQLVLGWFLHCMSTAASAGMQAALLIREKQRLRRKKLRKGRAELPTHIATREIAPFPQYPPGFMVKVSIFNFFLIGNLIRNRLVFVSRR